MKNLFQNPDELGNLSEALPVMLDELANLSASGDADRAKDVKTTILSLFGDVIGLAITEMERSGR